MKIFVFYRDNSIHVADKNIVNTARRLISETQLPSLFSAGIPGNPARALGEFASSGCGNYHVEQTMSCTRELRSGVSSRGGLFPGVDKDVWSASMRQCTGRTDMSSLSCGKACVG